MYETIELKIYAVLFTLVVIACLIVISKILNVICKIIRHIKCKQKYKNIVNNLLEKCDEIDKGKY